MGCKGGAGLVEPTQQDRAKEEFVESIFEGPQGDVLVLEQHADVNLVVLPGDMTGRADAAQPAFEWIGQIGQARRELARTGAIKTIGRAHAECFMGAEVIVFVLKLGETTLL